MHVAEVNPQSRLHIFLFRTGTFFSIALLLYVELKQPRPQAFEYRIIVKLWAPQRLFSQLKAFHILSHHTYLIEITVAVEEVWIDLLVILPLRIGSL